MRLISKEIHYYQPNKSEYVLKNTAKVDYRVLLVEGYSGDQRYRFIENTDFIVDKGKIIWLSGGTTPELAPSHLGILSVVFEVTYILDDNPIESMEQSVFPFMKWDGIYMTIVRAIGSQIIRVYELRDNLIKNHDLLRSQGSDLDHLATWYNETRLAGESDKNFRDRLIGYFTSYISSGTKETVSIAIEAFTGVEPTIVELWQSISSYNYNADDFANPSLSPNEWRTYLYAGGIPDESLTFQAYYFDFSMQLSTFFCILPFATIAQYGAGNIKNLLDNVKAGGIQAYLGWLIEEHFQNSDDWEVILP